MKRILIPVLSFLILLSACSSTTAEEKPEADAPAEISIAANENCSFSITGADRDEEVFFLSARCENRTDSLLSFSFDNVSINDYMIPPDWKSEIPAGKKSMEKIAFPLEELDECGIETVEDVSFDLVVCSADEPAAQPLLHSTCTLLFRDGQPDSVRYSEAEVIEEESEIDDSAEAVPVVDAGPGDRIYAGGDKIVWLRSDGTVKGAGYVDGHAQELNAWRDITSVAVASSHTMGLRKDGTIDQIGGGSKLNSDHLGDVAHIAAGKDHSVIVHSDGSCTLLGYSSSLVIGCFEDLPHITLASVGSSHSSGMNAEGHWFVAGNANYGQEDLSYLLSPTKLICGGDHTVALDSRGRVEAVGANNYGQCETQGWNDIIDIAAGALHTVGLRSDGTVLAAGHNQYGQCNVRGWNDIVAVACGDYFTVGVRADGKVLVAHNGSHAEKAQKLAETWVLPNPERTDGLDF